VSAGSASFEPGRAGLPPYETTAKPAADRIRSSSALRLIRLYLTSRRLPLAGLALIGCAVALRVLSHWPFDTYGALQLPLLAEAAAAAIVAVVAGSPFGEPELVTGRRLLLLRLGNCVVMSAIAIGALAVAGATAAHLAGGEVEVLRNTAGLIGIGLLGGALLGSALGWVGPLGYLVIGTYALYSDWHPPTLTSPWIWPGRPGYDVGGALCAAVVFAAGTAVMTIRGSRQKAAD
jgi:hypothetical protein